MRSLVMVAALAGITVAIPTPQAIDYAGVDADPDPVLVSAPLDVQSNIPPAVAPAPIEPITTDVSKVKRDTCVAQPNGYGPVPTPDTPEAFSSDPDFQAISSNAPTPDGYSLAFTGLQGSLSASRYMGLYTLESYDTLGCASKCDQVSGCQAFGIYIERDPSVTPGSDCPNPSSVTNFKCTLWGAPVVADEATNKGQWRSNFQVVVAGSNGYNKNAPPQPIDGFSGPTELGGAINAPSDSSGYNTFMGYQFFPFSQSQGYDPHTCATFCTTQTGYNSRHPADDGTYQTCVFFNAYVLSEDSIPQGLYCSLYNETWAASYGTNYGQYRGSDRFTVSQSYSYSLSQ